MDIDYETRVYVDSETEFNYLRFKGLLERVFGFVTRHNMHLLSFAEVVDKLRLRESIFIGLHDIPIANIVGSTGRYEEFTRHFFPQGWDKRNKERWRNIYTLAVTGRGFPPIDVYKIDQVYFVKDGNHRVSVARDLGWETIQANVTELPSSISLEPNVRPDELLMKQDCAHFLERTHLDLTRPDSKQHLDFTEAGGYQSLLRHIKLHLSLLSRTHPDLNITNPDQAMQYAAADWYDHVYLPAIEALRQSNIMEQFPQRTESDLYMWLMTHQARLREVYAFETLVLPETVADFLTAIEQVNHEMITRKKTKENAKGGETGE